MHCNIKYNCAYLIVILLICLWPFWSTISPHCGLQRWCFSSFLSQGIMTKRQCLINSCISSVQFSSVQSLSRVRLFVTPSTAALQASQSITNSWSLPKLMSIKLLMASNHLILCCPLLLLPSIFSSIRVFSNQSTPRIRWPKYWSFSFNISPSNEHPGLISLGWTGWISLQSNNTVQKHQFFSAQFSLQSNSHSHT